MLVGADGLFGLVFAVAVVFYMLLVIAAQAFDPRARIRPGPGWPPPPPLGRSAQLVFGTPSDDGPPAEAPGLDPRPDDPAPDEDDRALMCSTYVSTLYAPAPQRIEAWLEASSSIEACPLERAAFRLGVTRAGRIGWIGPIEPPMPDPTDRCLRATLRRLSPPTLPEPPAAGNRGAAHYEVQLRRSVDGRTRASVRAVRGPVGPRRPARDGAWMVWWSGGCRCVHVTSPRP